MPVLLFCLILGWNVDASMGVALAFQNQLPQGLLQLQSQERSASILLDEALLYECLGDPSKAMTRVFEANRLSPDPDILMLHLGQIIYAVRRQDSTAIAETRRVLRWLEIHAPAHPIRAELTAELASVQIYARPTDSLACWMDRLGLIRQWRMLGPFENVSNSGMARVLAPEMGLGWKTAIQGKSGLSVSSRLFANQSPDGWLRIDQLQSLPNAVNYFATGVRLDKAQRVILSFGVSGAYTLWVNGERVLHEPVFRNMGVEGVRVSLPLRKGVNEVLVKVGHENDSRANFILRLSDSIGLPLAFQTAVPGTIKGGAQLASQAKILRPSWIKPGQTLSDTVRLATYLVQNDEFDEALPLLHVLLRAYPQSGWVHMLLGELYARQEKLTLADQYYQKARRLEPNLANGWDYEFGRRFAREDWPSAISWFESRPAGLVLSPEQIFSAVKAYLSVSRDTDAWSWVDSLVSGRPENPDAWIYASGVHAAIGDRKLSLQLLEQAGERMFAMPGLLSELMERYKSMGNMEAAIALLNKKLRLMPQSYFDWMNLADFLLQTKDLNASIEASRQGLAVNPFSYRLLLLQARAYEMRAQKGDTLLAVQAYRRALSVPGADFEVGERWYALQGKATLPELRQKWPLDSLVSEGSTWKPGQKDHALILLSQRSLRWHEWGASEQSVRLVVEVHTAKGVDQWKEQDAMDHFWSGDVQVDYAVTHKADGRTIEADAYGTKLVFQGLEPGDRLELEVSCREQKDGPLAGHFWAWHFMALTGPTLHSIFEIFTPESMQDRYRIFQHDAGVTPVKSKVSGLVRRAWRRDRVAGYPPEPGMPSWGDVLPKVVVSSVPSWESISTWYEMLSEGKTVSSPELRVLADSLFSTAKTPREKILRMQDWMVRNIRYSHQLFRQSGYIPQDATKTMLTRIGDCKDMAALGKALLRHAGIRSELVLVNTNDQDRKASLPMDLFNHCILWVDLEGGRYIDFTADQNGWESLPRSDQLALSLRIGLQRTDTALSIPLDQQGDYLYRESWDTLQLDGKLKRRMVTVRGGNFAASFREDYSQETPERIRDLSHTTLQYSYPGVDLHSLDPGSLDSLQQDIRYETRYSIRAYALSASAAWVVPVPWADQIDPHHLPGEARRRYPWVAWKNWAFWGEFRQTAHLLLPEGYQVLSIPPDQSLQGPMGRYITRYRMQGRVLEAERHWRPEPLELAPRDYASIRPELEKLIAADHPHLVLIPVAQ